MLRRKGGGLLKPGSIAMMRSVYWPGWGLGVRVVKNDRCLPDGCFGWSGAYGTHFWVDPSNDMYAIYMKNSLHDGGSGAKTSREFEKTVMEGLTEFL
jgi:CubicO group peptidase (beta-lactamase class C family)